MTSSDDQDVNSADAVIRAWCVEQMAPWLDRLIAPASLLATLDRLNRTEPNVFLYTIVGRQVQLAEKPPEGRHRWYEVSLSRAEMYHKFLQEVVADLAVDIAAPLAIYVGDGTLAMPPAPVFAFQKPQGNASVLLPDVDFVAYSFFRAPEHNDPIAYFDKACSAVFVGATTGGRVTQDVVRHLTLPRLRSAVFFRDCASVMFRLPLAVQCDSDETRALLRTIGIGDGVVVPWQDQLRHRFLISMDGNGAACSRVVRALLSNGVLLKYASPNVLFYFSGLQPWLHYVPIQHDDDVLHIVETERRTPGFFAPVAQAGRAFACRFLTREALMCYTAALLRLYARWHGGELVPTAGTPRLDILAELPPKSGQFGCRGGRVATDPRALQR
jgi:hypothetical protein